VSANIVTEVTFSQSQLARSNELSAFLGSLPPLRVLLEHLTFTRLAKYKAHVAWFAAPNDNGDVVLEDHYGHLDPEKFAAIKHTVWDSNFMSTALSNGNAVTVPWKPTAGTDACYLGSEIKVVAALPMYVNSHRRYSLNIGCAGTVGNAKSCLSDLIGDIPLLSLYLSYFNDRRQLVGEQIRSASSNGISANLTPRQFTILRLMSEGMKNREIAFSIGYSDSTVRLETMEIYKRLGTNGRHEAVRVANRLGLLENED
jgi:DNA-binding CsgD family transcriptional regulator